MSKIIIHNNSKHGNENALRFVVDVISNGFMSGKNQYCWLTKYESVTVHAKPTRGTTHTFEVRDL